MYSVATLERICADAWPPLIETKLGEWRLRAASGYTGRANSALAVGDPGVPADQALRTIGEFCPGHRLPHSCPTASDHGQHGETRRGVLHRRGRRHDRPGGAGAVVDDMLYLSNLAVRATNRRQSLTIWLLDTLGAWASGHDTTQSVLQVAASNTTANTLYTQRGFTESHRYRYWIPNSTCEDHTL